MTKIVNKKGPVYDRCAEAFGPLPEGVIFAYGDTIYNPAGHDIPPDLIVHEETHFKQQAEVGGPEAWWDRYLSDEKFRLLQEVEAYQEQLAWHMANTDRATRRECLRRSIKVLASPMYGRLVTKDEARALLMGWTWPL